MNRKFWIVFEKIIPGFIRRDGYDYGAVELVFGIEVPRDLRPIYLEKILAVIPVIEQARRKKNGQHPQAGNYRR